MAFVKKTWADGPGGGTPITAAELNRIEAGIAEKAAKGDKGDPGEPGKDGAPGPKGDKGDPGEPAKPFDPAYQEMNRQGIEQVHQGKAEARDLFNSLQQISDWAGVVTGWLTTLTDVLNSELAVELEPPEGATLEEFVESPETPLPWQ